MFVAIEVLEGDGAADLDRGRPRVEGLVDDRDRRRGVRRGTGVGARVDGIRVATRGRAALTADPDPAEVARVVVLALIDVRVRAGGRKPDLERLAGLEVAGIELAARSRTHAVAVVVAIDEPHDAATRHAHVPVAHSVTKGDRDVGRARGGVVSTDRTDDQGNREDGKKGRKRSR